MIPQPATGQRGRNPWRPHLQLRAEPWPCGASTRRQRENPREPDLAELAARIDVNGPFDYWQRQEAGKRLRDLCVWFDRRLDRPLKVVRHAGCVEIVALDYLKFRSDPLNGRVEFEVYRAPEGWRRYPLEADIGHLVHPKTWVNITIIGIGYCDEGRQGDLFRDLKDLLPINAWVVGHCARLIARSRRFKALRESILAALEIPQEVLAIARACRVQPKNRMLPLGLLNLVWRNLPAFRRLARETPQLLPLLYACWDSQQTCAEGKASLPESWWHATPVADLRRHLLAEGLQPATWRYLVRHGCRIFHPVWQLTQKSPAFAVAKIHLQMLQWARLPPPPTRLSVQALLRFTCADDGNQFRIRPGFFHCVLPEILHAALVQADRQRGTGGCAAFRDDFLEVLEWGRLILDFSDRQQVKAGWPWMVRQARQARDETQTIRRLGARCWLPRLGRFCLNDIDVVPLASTADLVRESAALHNCVQDYVDDCATGVMEIYSLRRRLLGRRLGCVGFKFDDDGFPRFLDAKCLANDPPNAEVRRLASEINRRLFEAAINRYCRSC